ncbi:MAG TPA: phytoene/squalene synthase family protein [Stellaceae bacterium]|nr:phytoene/squalene synthase family protein [Stellaceae bacterium]
MSAETRKGRSPGAIAAPGLSPGLSAPAAIVRRHDRDRYQTALFAPSDRREALFALYAFNYEVARVRETVTTPMLGQIRLQWWREVVEAAYIGTPARRHEVVQPLVAAIAEFGLSRAHFDRIIDTRERDLAETPPSDLAALVDYAEGTSSTLLHLALEALGAAEPAPVAAAREVGIAYALAGLLRAMPFHAASGRSYIPEDVAARVGLDPASYARRRDTPALRNAAAELAEAAATHLAAGRQRRGETPRQARAALLPAVIADRFLRCLKRAGFNPFAPELAAPDPLQSWRLAAAALRNRF